MGSSSLLGYYQDNRINPVPIPLQDNVAWETHVAKRRNLYERHLGIPLSLLRDRSVLEFGCNSGENPLVLASVGANLTLVEPNGQVIPQLRELFAKFGLEHQIAALEASDIESFQTNQLYDIVIAEGFLNHLPNCGDMIRKVCRLVVPGGLGVISLDDRYGHLLEITRKLVFHRACRLEEIDDMHGPSSLEVAKSLYLEDFGKLNASRPFEAWWEDVLLNPFVGSEYLWTYQQLFPLLEQEGCEFHASSPSWSASDSFEWYKNVLDPLTRHERVLEEWAELFPFFLTGLRPAERVARPLPDGVADAVSGMISDAWKYVGVQGTLIGIVSYPPHLDDYFQNSDDQRLLDFNQEMKRIYEALQTTTAASLISAYNGARLIRGLWGAPCHYICVSKPG